MSHQKLREGHVGFAAAAADLRDLLFHPCPHTKPVCELLTKSCVAACEYTLLLTYDDEMSFAHVSFDPMRVLRVQQEVILRMLFLERRDCAPKRIGRYSRETSLRDIS